MYPDTVNEIEISGRLLSRAVNKNGEHYMTLVSKNGVDIFPRVQFDETLLPECNKHARLRVKGHFETREIYIARNKKVIKQIIVADSIEKETTLVEKKYGIPGKFYQNPSCKIYLKGIVSSVKKENDWYRINIMVNNPYNYSISYPIRISMREIDRQPDIKKGSLIYTVCKMTTPKKEVDGQPKYYEDIMVDDIAVVS